MDLNAQVEDSLAPLVYTKIQEEIPQLFDKLIGFQLIKTKNEGTQSLGMMVFAINGEHHFMPVFFSNGYLKPLILMYNYKSKKFKAATEKYIDKLMKINPGISASLVDKDAYNEARSSPDLRELIKPPILNKFGSHNIFKKAGSYNVPIYSLVLKGMGKADYGSKFMKSFIKKSSDVKKEMTKILMNDDSIVEQVIIEYPEFMPAIREDKSIIYSNNPIPEPIAELIIKDFPSPENTIQENELLYNGELIVNDKRKVKSIVTPINVEDGLTYGGVTENGIYDVLSYNGKWKRMVCLLNGVDPSNNYGSSEENNLSDLLIGLFLR